MGASKPQGFRNQNPPFLLPPLLFMRPGAQKAHPHRVPAGSLVGPRVNLQGSSMFRDGQKIATF